jgi:hypothetical protein
VGSGTKQEVTYYSEIPAVVKIGDMEIQQLWDSVVNNRLPSSTRIDLDGGTDKSYPAQPGLNCLSVHLSVHMSVRPYMPAD